MIPRSYLRNIKIHRRIMLKSLRHNFSSAALRSLPSTSQSPPPFPQHHNLKSQSPLPSPPHASFSTSTKTTTNNKTTSHYIPSAPHITFFGGLLNLSLSLSKFLVGLLTTSPALLSDSAHSLSDVSTDLVTYYTYKKAREPKGEKRCDDETDNASLAVTSKMCSLRQSRPLKYVITRLRIPLNSAPRASLVRRLRPSLRSREIRSCRLLRRRHPPNLHRSWCMLQQFNFFI